MKGGSGEAPQESDASAIPVQQHRLRPRVSRLSKKPMKGVMYNSSDYGKNYRNMWLVLGRRLLRRSSLVVKQNAEVKPVNLRRCHKCVVEWQIADCDKDGHCAKEGKRERERERERESERERARERARERESE